MDIGPETTAAVIGTVTGIVGVILKKFGNATARRSEVEDGLLGGMTKFQKQLLDRLEAVEKDRDALHQQFHECERNSAQLAGEVARANTEINRLTERVFQLETLLVEAAKGQVLLTDANKGNPSLLLGDG